MSKALPDMTTWRAYVRRSAGENVESEAPLQTSLIPANHYADQVTNAVLRDAFWVFSQAMTAQDNIQVVFLMNPNMGTTTSRVRDFTRMNPPEFNGYNAKEDPH